MPIRTFIRSISCQGSSRSSRRAHRRLERPERHRERRAKRIPNGLENTPATPLDRPRKISSCLASATAIASP